MIFLALFVTVVILQQTYFTKNLGEKELIEFEEALHRREAVLQELFSDLIEEGEKENIVEVLNQQSEMLKKLADQEGIYIYYYDKGRLTYWSDHSVSLRMRWSRRLNSRIYQTVNGTYLAYNQTTENGVLFGLIGVKKEYAYENRYLKNSYYQNLPVPEKVDLIYQSGPGLSDVYSINGEYLFSLDLASNLKNNKQLVSLSTIFFLLAIIVLFGIIGIWIDGSQSPMRRARSLTLGLLIILLISYLIIHFQFPGIIFESSLFKPDVYASLNFASLGHLLLFVILICMIVMLFYWFFNRSSNLMKNSRLTIAAVLVLLGSVWFVITHHIGESLVMDSTISFEAYKLNNLSINTFIGLIILLLAYLIYGLLFDKALQLFKLPLKGREYAFLLLAGLIVQIPFLLIDFWSTEIETSLFFLAISGSLIFLRTTHTKIRFSRFFPLLLCLAIFLTIDLQNHTSIKQNSQKEVELAKLSSEHDAVAEMLFSELSEQLGNDSLLIQRFHYQIIDIDLVFDYLQRNYFSGYWTKYDLQITLCRPADSVLIDVPTPDWFPCYPFFTELVEDDGILIENSNFYFLNNLNGRISYVGVIPYLMNGNEITLFLELNSKIISEELGYPTLLLKENFQTGSRFSYAKYNNGLLIANQGDLTYRRSSDYYTNRSNTFETITRDGYDHSILNLDSENTVIVSIPVVSFTDKLISFSYLFAIILIIFTLSYLIVSASHIRATVIWDFKNKIQYSFIGLLFFTFIVICSGTIYFVIEQYRMKHEDNLQNTLRSLYIELIHKVEFEEDLRNWTSDSYFNLDELLMKFSNVFYTDINMYDEEGILLATSRSEIFDQQLLSNRMNREAFEKLSFEDYSTYIHTEQIGDMLYQSAYVPLLNSENRLLAYMNLPYFTQPEILAQEVSNLVVAILNIYVILLLLILFLSVFLADRITQPLRFIQSRIAQLSLSKSNEKIVYRGRDEIAGLVDEYNYMVDELVRSAKLLAQSERESAWREMAKQIAHEIKNPLTPMKLNIQHMLRMISEDNNNIEEKVEKVSMNLIEQIDLLTSIANEFSDFAKMPKARNKKINIVLKLQNVVNLFENSEGVTIDLNVGGLSTLYSYGDPEQFQRVIINLVKNGIQAIPEDRDKYITITLEESEDDTALVTVTDNGKGISDEIQKKMFQPNFTTKSGGMGMGLAISASIVKSMGGSIWYNTEANQGTTFFIKVPVVRS